MKIGNHVVVVSSPYRYTPVGTRGTIEDIRLMHFCPKTPNGQHVNHEGSCEHLYILTDLSEGFGRSFRSHEIKEIE